MLQLSINLLIAIALLILSSCLKAEVEYREAHVSPNSTKVFQAFWEYLPGELCKCLATLSWLASLGFSSYSIAHLLVARLLG